MWHVAYHPIKGRTVIASENIPKGSIIIREKPALLAEDALDAIYQLKSDDIGEFELLAPHTLDKYMIGYEDLCRDIARLPGYMQPSLRAMQPDRLRLLVAKFYRNAFTYTNHQSALLFQGALLNHSCDHNVDFHIDKNGDFLFHANRDIQAGEECCDNYLISCKRPLDFLLRQYGFVCSCPTCAFKTKGPE
jgi:hypothetical protein